MKVMHHVMHLDSAVMNGFKVKAYQAGQCVSNPQMLSCDQCNTTSCHNLLCASIHAAPVFNLVDTFKVNLQPLQIDSNVIFVVPLTTTTVQPELPPPNTISI
ncbi:hypothetical protein HVMH_1681 [Hydrogenovibrio marinus]|nr:hypothetical protein HVMH_1681 [Hydrogenovibrio marinus]